MNLTAIPDNGKLILAENVKYIECESNDFLEIKLNELNKELKNKADKIKDNEGLHLIFDGNYSIIVEDT